MSISSIGSYGISYDNLSSGYKIASAADNPAGLIISEELTSQSNGYDVGTDNAQSGQDLLNVSEGALGSISDSLQRIRELSVKASNSATLSRDDLNTMQAEVDQLKKDIQFTAKNTEFNTIKLLDGSKADLNLATNPQGTGMKISTENSTLENLGIKDFDLTKDFDISTIDNAIKMVDEARSNNGASYNALSYVVNNNQYTGINLTSSLSRIKDLDYGVAVSEMKKEEILQNYKYFMHKKENENALLKQSLIF